MSVANPLWGAPRIHGELLKLGIDVGQTTVAKYMAKRRRRPSQSWKTFLRNQADGIASIDMFVVPTISFRQLYGLLVLRHSRRKLLWLGVTAHPNAEWIARQLTEACGLRRAVRAESIRRSLDPDGSSLGGEPHTRLRYFCSAQHTDTALYPIIGQMERAAELAHDDPPQAKLDKLDSVLAETAITMQDAALFAEMLSLSNDGRYPALDLTPEQRRQGTLEALTAHLAGLASQQPVLMIFEDVHWIDPTSLEVFGRTVDRIKALPALLIVTFRPEFDAPWVGRSHVTSLTLNRLEEREAAAIIATLSGTRGFWHPM